MVFQLHHVGEIGGGISRSTWIVSSISSSKTFLGQALQGRLVTNPSPHLFTKENPSFDVHDVTEGWDILDVYISTIKLGNQNPWVLGSLWVCYKRYTATPWKMKMLNPEMVVWKMTFPFQFGDFWGSSAKIFRQCLASFSFNAIGCHELMKDQPSL